MSMKEINIMNVRKHTQSKRSIFYATTETIDSTDDRGKRIDECFSGLYWVRNEVEKGILISITVH